jgi:hypothetical protein
MTNVIMNNHIINPIMNSKIRIFCNNIDKLPLEICDIIYLYAKNPSKETPTASIINRINKAMFTTILNDPISMTKLEKELNICICVNNKFPKVIVTYRLFTRRLINPLNVLRRKL